MTISEENLEIAKIVYALNPVIMEFLSEIERLRADLKCTEELYAGLQEDNSKLQAENAKLKSKYARVIALGNLENYVGDVIDKPIKYSEEK